MTWNPMSQRYTLDEARDELARRECAESGHRPSIEVRDVDRELGAWMCDCHTVTWAPNNPE